MQAAAANPWMPARFACSSLSAAPPTLLRSAHCGQRIQAASVASRVVCKLPHRQLAAPRRRRQLNRRPAAPTDSPCPTVSSRPRPFAALYFCPRGEIVARVMRYTGRRARVILSRRLKAGRGRSEGRGDRRSERRARCENTSGVLGAIDQHARGKESPWLKKEVAGGRRRVQRADQGPRPPTRSRRLTSSAGSCSRPQLYRLSCCICGSSSQDPPSMRLPL